MCMFSHTDYMKNYKQNSCMYSDKTRNILQ